MARGTYQTIVRWGFGPIGNITEFDAVYGVAPYLTGYDDISALVQTVGVKRGKNDPAGAIAAGTLTLTLADPDGWFIPGNSSSPLVGLAADGLGYLLPYHTIRVQGFNPSTAMPLFYGYILRIVPDPVAKTATIEATDALHRLSLPLNQTYVIKADGFTQATYSTILNLLNTRMGGHYSYAYSAAGNTIGYSPGITATAGTAPLTIIGDILAADRGLFYVRADGTFQYLDRHYHDRSPRNAAQSTINYDQIRRLATGVDIATVANSATVTGLGDLIAAPSAAPTLTHPTATAPATSSLAAGGYTVAYSYTNSGGQTAKSPTAAVTVGAGEVVHVAAVTPLPSGATGVNWYLSATAGDSATLRLARSGTGVAEDFATLPPSDAALPIATGTARNPVAQTVTDAASEAKYDPRPLGAITTPYLPTNADALSTATWLVNGRKDVASVAYAADLDGDVPDSGGGAALDSILARDLHDRVRVAALGTGTFDYTIIGIEHTITADRHHTCKWLLQKRRAQDVGAIVGYSRVDQCAVGYAVI